MRDQFFGEQSLAMIGIFREFSLDFLCKDGSSPMKIGFKWIVSREKCLNYKAIGE